MLKHLMNGSSLLAITLRDAENDNGADADPKAKLREQLSKGNVQKEGIQNSESNPPNEEENEEDGEGEEEEENEEDENEEVDSNKKEETEEEKAEREKQEKIAAKAQRKQDRMQRRIDEATRARKEAEAERDRLKAQLEADPDKKLTEEEVEARAEAIAAKKLADKQIEEIQSKFNEACEKLQKDASKIDKDFDDKIADIAADIGPIPSFMIGVLDDLDNGGEVLAFIANDDELAEKIWNLKKNPAKMTKEIVEISNKLSAAKKKPKKEISRVPDPPEPVKTNRNSNSAIITEADTKNMDSYVAKRQAQMLEKRKLRGF
jgi:hypothetical protein